MRRSICVNLNTVENQLRHNLPIGVTRLYHCVYICAPICVTFIHLMIVLKIGNH